MYHTRSLADNLLYVYWVNNTQALDAGHFIQDLKTQLNLADGKLYFLCDLRRNPVTQLDIVRQLGKLAGHPNWGGGPCITSWSASHIYAQLVNQYVNSGMQKSICNTVEDALQQLEVLNPGITQGYNWDDILSLSAADIAV